MQFPSDRFEVWVDDFRRRTLDSVFDEKDLAISVARKLFRERRLRSVDVERVTPRRLGGEDRKTVHTDKRHDERKQVALSGEFDGRVVCKTVDDFYSLPAMTVIGRILRGYLDHQGLTVIELLHDPQQAKRLNNYSALRTRAISLAAAAQAREGGLDVEQRRAALDALAERVITRIRTLTRKSHSVDLGRGLAQACPMDSYYDEATDREFLLYAALTRRLAAAKSWGHKIQLLLDLYDPSAPAFAGDLIDRFVADMMRSVAAVRALCGEHRDLAPALVDLARLGRGRLAQGYDTSPAVEPLNDHIGMGRFPVTTAAIIDRLVQGLESPGPLIIEDHGGLFDAFSDVVAALTNDDGTLLGGDRMKEALDLRCSRLAQAEIDSRLAADRKPARRIERLLDFAGQVYGARSRAIVWENLDTVIRTAAESRSLLPADCPVLDGLQVLADWQRRVAAVTGGDRDDAAEAVRTALDRAAVLLIEDRRLLENLAADTVSASSKLEVMTALCRSDVVAFGQACEMVRHRVYETLRQPAFLAGLAADGGAGEDRESRMRNLQTLLRENGIT